MIYNIYIYMYIYNIYIYIYIYIIYIYNIYERKLHIVWPNSNEAPNVDA